MTEPSRQSGWPLWGAAWRLGLLAAVAAFWMLPEAWLDSARHFGGKFLVVFPVANLGGWVAPLLAVIEVFRLLRKNRASERRFNSWFVFRAIWAGLVLCHLLVLLFQM